MYICQSQTLPTKVYIAKAMIFLVIMHICESCTIMKAEHQKINAFELWCWGRLLRVPWTASRSNQPILKEINPDIHWKNWCWNWSSNTLVAAAAAAKSLQSCLTLCDPIDGSPPGSPVPGILQARTLEWVAISFSSVWKWKVKVKSLGCVSLSVTPQTAAHQAPPSMGFSRQEYWSGFATAFSNTLATWCQEPTHWKRPSCSERLKA